MKEINKLEEYLNQRTEKRKKRNKFFIAIIFILVLGALGYLGFWLYTNHGKTAGSNNKTATNIAPHSNENGEKQNRVNESPVIIIDNGNIYPSLSIEGKFEVGRPLNFVIKNYKGEGRHLIDFGDDKEMTIKNSTKHLYRQAGEYQIQFTPAGMDKPVVETIYIQNRNGEDANQAAFASIIEKNESQESEKAFLKYNYESNASFPGGTAALMSYLQTHIGSVSGVEGRVIVGFDIDKEGTVGNIKIVDSISKDVDKQVLAAFDGMPKWKPAIKDGVEVTSEYRLPFYFQKEI